MVKKVDIEGIKGDCYSVDGTPADCVKIGTNKFVNDKVDLVVSGINNGFNLGTDVLYSGTVSAAIEAAIYKIPSIAVSMDRDKGKIKYDVAAKFISQLIKNIDVYYISKGYITITPLHYDLTNFKLLNDVDKKLKDIIKFEGQ